MIKTRSSSRTLSLPANSLDDTKKHSRKKIHFCIDIDDCFDSLTAEDRVIYNALDYRLPQKYVDHMLRKMKETIFSKYLIEDKLKGVDIVLRLFSNRKNEYLDKLNSDKNGRNHSLAPDIIEKFSEHMKNWIDPHTSSVNICSDYYSEQISDSYFNAIEIGNQLGLLSHQHLNGPAKDKVDLAMAILAPLAGTEKVEVILIDDRFSPDNPDSPLTSGFCGFLKKYRNLIPKNVTISAFQYDPYLDFDAFTKANAHLLRSADYNGSIYYLDVDKEHYWCQDRTKDTQEKKELSGYALFDKKQKAFRAVEDFQCIKGTGIYEAPKNHYQLWDEHIQPAGIQYLEYKGNYKKEIIDACNHGWRKKSQELKSAQHSTDANTKEQLPEHSHKNKRHKKNVDHLTVPTSTPNGDMAIAASLAADFSAASYTSTTTEESDLQAQKGRQTRSKRAWTDIATPTAF
ncbi:MAG: hypothetical protein VX737_05210 [Pseudomonadota bacterium]|nr:hypothetical protein [Pseudomonadota bacterium]